MRLKFRTALACSIFLIISTITYAQFTVNVEGGAVFTQYNELQIPSDEGTEIALGESLDQDFSAFFRTRVNYTLNEKHTFSLLVAPLQVTYSGAAPYDIRFKDANFAEGEELDVRYRFDSYRITYRFNFLRRDQFFAGAGVTLKVRDADITFLSGDKGDISPDLGIVPLINFYARWKPNETNAITFSGDALAAPQGRAADVALFYNYQVYDNVWLKAGYRLLEGGADNDQLYTFSYFHYASIGLWITHDFEE
jgi:hypothetical protein